MADELERLLGLPLDEFTAARTEAVKRLRKDGRADEAAELQAVRKPTAPVWGLNQAARREPGDIRALVRAAQRLREDPAGADADFRAHLGDVVREAERALAEAKLKVSQEMTRRIATTARAAAASLPDELTRGVLRDELEPSGFEAMAGMAPPPKPAGVEEVRGQGREDAAAKRKRVEEARGRADRGRGARRVGSGRRPTRPSARPRRRSRPRRRPRRRCARRRSASRRRVEAPRTPRRSRRRPCARP